MSPTSPASLRALGLLAAVLAASYGASSTCAADETSPRLPRTGALLAGLESFDTMMVEFLRDQGVHGASLAVGRDGRLLLARGYGWADRERTRPVRPRSLFRIASLSKPITAAAVLRTVEAGKLSLDDRILEVLAGRVDFELRPADERFGEITILELLQHTAGFDRDVSFDPMFRAVEIAESLGVEPPAEREHILRYMLERPLDFAPGERYAYSNFGYLLLGMALERVHGDDYASIVQESILRPAGARDFRLGRSLLEERRPGEVFYHGMRDDPVAVVGPVGKPVLPGYGTFYLEAMDAHGGWIGHAIDLVRFAMALDDDAERPILSASSRRVAFAPPTLNAPGSTAGDAAEREDDRRAAGGENDSMDDRGEANRRRQAYYGCGWKVRVRPDRGINTWHTGSLDGTAALLVRRWDGLTWAVLFNQRRGTNARHLGAAIDRLVHRAAGKVATWPQGDLSPLFPPIHLESRHGPLRSF